MWSGRGPARPYQICTRERETRHHARDVMQAERPGRPAGRGEGTWSSILVASWSTRRKEMSHQTTQKEKRERLVLVNHPPSPDQALVNSALTGAITWISISGSRAGLYRYHLDPSPCNPNPKPHHSPIHLHSAITNHRESKERYLLRALQARNSNSSLLQRSINLPLDFDS